MAALLEASAVRSFEQDGVIFPLRVCSQTEAHGLLCRLEGIEGARAGRLPPSHNVKAHLLLPWLWDLVHDPRILDPVEALLGPTILCWAASFFIKDPGDHRHVPWHQDTTYWGLSEPRAVTAWVAFSESTVANGCLRVLKGSHLAERPHSETRDATSMLPVRERLVDEIDESLVENVELSPGEMSLHHGRLIHGSAPNEGAGRRVGFAIRYIAGDVRQIGPARGTATLVRGKDFGRFDLESRPAGDFDAEAMARYKSILRRSLSHVGRVVGDRRTRAGEADGER